MAACLAIWAVQWNSEEYAVYEAAIREAFSGEDVWYYSDSGHYTACATFRYFQLPFREIGPSADCERQLHRKKFVPVSRPAKVCLPHPFTMVSQNGLDKVYRPGQIDSPNAVELSGLLRKSWGVITLSRVGFDLADSMR